MMKDAHPGVARIFYLYERRSRRASASRPTSTWESRTEYRRGETTLLQLVPGVPGVRCVGRFLRAWAIDDARAVGRDSRETLSSHRDVKPAKR